MFLGFLTLITALTISAVAIYYSVAGLAAIFAAAVIPIIIMGGTLEIAKLVTAVWLHRFWHQATWWLKTYLTTAVVVLMFITSMGIFGFLSNAHVQQTAQGDSATAEIERLESEISRQKAVISRAEDKIESVQTQGIGGDANLQAQIDREQERIDLAYSRAEPLIQEQRDIIQRSEGRIVDQIDAIDRDVERVDSAIANGDIAAAQSIIGTEADGIYGPNTRSAVEAYKTRQAEQRAQLEQRLAEVGDNPRVQAARAEINQIRDRVESQVAESNQLINRLRAQLGTDTATDIDAVIDEQNSRITSANSRIDTLTEQQFALEAQYRQLEAEVGPIKYIAEFVYAEDANKDLLEEAVRWVIVIIILVFDPLAVLLLIASQYTFRWHKELIGVSTVSDSAVSNTPPIDQKVNSNEPGEEFKEEPALHNTSESEIHNNDEFDDEFDDEFENAEPRLKDAMKTWKQENPDSSLKLQRKLLRNGKINELPWMIYLEPEADVENSADSDAVEAAKWAQEQIDASKKKESNMDSKGSEQTSNQNSEFIAGYVQNAEQNQSTIWSRVRK